MRRYETFNPAIPEETEATGIEELLRFEEKREEERVVRTKKPTENKKSKTKKPKKEKTEAEQGFFTKIANFFTSMTMRWLVGLFMAFFAVYLGIAFISYFVTCVADQSEINNTSIGMSGAVANAGGEAGARLSEFLINEFFGVGSFVIIVWLIAMGLRLISGKPRFKPVNFTVKCLVAFITLSLIVGLLTLGMQSTVNWGGYHGKYVNEFIIHFLGWIGATMLCIFMVCVFFLICMRDILKWVMKKKRAFDEARKIRKAEIEAQKAKEMELERQRLAEDMAEQKLSTEISGIDEYDDLPGDDEVNEVMEVKFGDGVNGLDGLYGDLPDIEETMPLNGHPHADYMPKEDPEIATESVDKEKAESHETADERENGDIQEYDLTSEDDDNKDELDVASGLELTEESTENLTYSTIDEREEKDDLTYPEIESTAPLNGHSELIPVSHKEVIPSNDASDNFVETEEEKEEDLKMVVNVNSISQVNVKNGGLNNNDSPAKFPYKFPSFDILKPGATSIAIDADEQNANKEQIRRTLMDFDIPIVSIEATIGPTVTLYEIVPDKGIRVSKIRALVDDIALSLSAENGVRIIAPIPGKGTVGIEVANKVKQTVSMQTVLKSSKFQNTKYELPIALGSTISNEVYVADLANMPHLLVAGATGQGKSVGLNAIIASLLYSKRPDELKLVMVDPKMVEFSLYAKIESHYLAKLPGAEDAIITDMDKVVSTLNSLCIEMDNRYQLLKDAATRKITEYNEKFLDHRLNPEKGHRFLPYVVVVVDEFADLIMTAGRDVETPIARLAQKARAVGIHVILATQRPSANVITGIIRANFPTRIAFKVSTGVDSKVILDATGAQQLIGKGDMLVSNNGPMVRVQCAFIDTPEVEKICEHIERQPYAQGAYLLPEPPVSKGDGDGEGLSSSERDPLFEEVARLVVHSNNASTSSLQRRYSIGYNRAGKIMDQLEAAGIVGAAQGGKPRAVLIDPVSLDLLLESM